MRSGIFITLTILKVITVFVGIVITVVNLYRAASRQNPNGYSKAFKAFLSVFGVVLLLTVLDFLVAYFVKDNS